MKKTRIFLASSSELLEDRREFEIYIARKNSSFVDKGIFLELVIWENFLDAMAPDGLQAEYNKAIQDCDIFVMLYFTKVGKYTAEEFATAFGTMRETGKPQIFTYFKDAPVNMGSIRADDFNSLMAFQAKLQELKHYQTKYGNLDGLKFHFETMLDKLYDRGWFEADKSVHNGSRAEASNGDAEGYDPDDLADITNLKLQGDEFYALVPHLADLVNLEALCIQPGQIDALPDNIGDIPRLSQLLLMDNALSELPPSVGNLVDLKVLDVGGNQLDSLPDEVGNLEKLEILDLSRNHLREFPFCVTKLRSVMYCVIQNNQLTDIPDAIAKMSSLRVLAINDNRLQEVPQALAQLQLLAELYIGGNPFCDTPAKAQAAGRMLKEWLPYCKIVLGDDMVFE